jgi:uncharacterized damage-inducible protein DinB
MNLLTCDALKKLFDRDLKRLEKEIKQYQNESTLWKTEGEIANSAGNLCLHLIGNLNHFIGHVLGRTDYIRKRDDEFNQSDIAVSELTDRIEKTREVVNDVLQRMTENQVTDRYPLEVFGYPMSNIEFLIHLQGHLNYHLGQINYHRRLLDRQA